MIEVLFELLFEFFGEVVLQVAFEALAQAGLSVLRHPDRPPKDHSPWLKSLGYALLGAIAGGISLWILPSLMFRSAPGRIANLVLSPLAAGAVMALVGVWRSRRRGTHRTAIGLERFSDGYLFALAMGVVRFGLAA